LYGASNFFSKSLGALPLYRLSPIIRTSSYGNFARDATSFSATLYCAESPVPLSPMTAIFSESLALGSVMSCAAGAAAIAATIASGTTRRDTPG